MNSLRDSERIGPSGRWRNAAASKAASARVASFPPTEPCRDAPAFAATRFRSHCAQPGLQALGNAGSGTARQCDFVFFKIGRQQEHRRCWFAEPYPRPPSKHRGRRPYPREQSQIQPTLEPTDGRDQWPGHGCPQPPPSKVVACPVTKRNQLRVDSRPSRQGDGGSSMVSKARQMLRQSGRHWFWRLHRFHC